MTSLHETAYPQLKADPSPKELELFYTPTADELAFVAEIAKRPLPRTAALISLKLFQRLGYFTPLPEVPATIRAHIAENAGTCGRFDQDRKNHAIGNFAAAGHLQPKKQALFCVP